MQKRRRGIGGAAVIAGVALAAAACGGGSSGTSGSGSGGNSSTGQSSSGSFKPVPVKTGGSITYAADQEPTGFNINTSKDNGTSVQNIIESVYPTAFHAYPDFTIHMDQYLLKSATQTKTSPQTIVYQINPAAKWSDGQPINADDFIYLWQHENGSNTKLDVASTTGYQNIGSVTGSNNGKTVTVVFKQPFSDWKSLFSNILPAHYMKTLGPDPAAWNDGLDKMMPISGGWFKITSYQTGNSLTLSRNDAYWGPKAHLDTVVFRFLPTSTTQPAALQNGEVQLIYPQPQLDEVQQVQNNPQVTNAINFGLSFEHLDFNFKNPFLADKQVREAIATALDRKEMLARTVAQFSSKAKVLGNRIWLTGQPEYVDNTPAGIGNGDVAKADQILTADGWKKGSDGVYAKNGKRLAFRFTTTSGNALRETQGNIFKAQMAKAGMAVTIANDPSTKYFGQDLPNGNFDVADFAWVGTPFAISSNQAIYTCNSGSNYGKYCNPAVDAAFKNAINDLNLSDQKAEGNNIDKMLWTDMVTIPLYQKPDFIAYDKKYGNIVDNSTSEGPFWNSYEWGLKK